MRLEKVEELIEPIIDNKDVKDVVTVIHLEDNFSFSCNICKLTQVKGIIKVKTFFLIITLYIIRLYLY